MYMYRRENIKKTPHQKRKELFSKKMENYVEEFWGVFCS